MHTLETLADDRKVEYFEELLLTASPFDGILVCRTKRFRVTIPWPFVSKLATGWECRSNSIPQPHYQGQLRPGQTAQIQPNAIAFVSSLTVVQLPA